MFRGGACGARARQSPVRVPDPQIAAFLSWSALRAHSLEDGRLGTNQPSGRGPQRRGGTHVGGYHPAAAGAGTSLKHPRAFSTRIAPAGPRGGRSVRTVSKAGDVAEN